MAPTTIGSDHSCLETILYGGDTIHRVDYTTVRPFDLSKLKLVSEDHRAIRLVDILDDDSRRALDFPADYILRDENYVIADEPSIPRNYSDPLLKAREATCVHG